MDARSALLGFALGVGSTAAWAASGAHAETEAIQPPTFTRKAFDEAVTNVLERYVEPVDAQDVLGRGLKHIVAGLDGHSSFLTARERKALGVGAGRAGVALALHLGTAPSEHWLEVVAVSPSSPAHAAGIAPGDQVLRVAGRSPADLLSQAEAEALLSGGVGDALALVVQHRGDPRPRRVELVLAALRTKLVNGKLLAGKVGHLKIQGFGPTTGDDAKQAIAGLRRAAGKGGLRGLVIDLRGNPGGEVDQALIVADLFVSKGALTRTRGRGGRVLREESAHAAGTDAVTPLAVVVDGHTASAAELLCAALQDHARAKVVGTKTYGKGTVQRVKGFPDGSVLTLTIARYYSPKDRAIDGAGITPDHRVPRGEDPLKRAVAEL